MLKIGARAHDYGRDEPQRLFPRIAADGFAAVMLAFQKAIAGVNTYYDVTEEKIRETKRACEDAGLALNTLGVYMELGMVDEEKRQAAVDQFKRGLEVAAKMGVPQVATETTPFHKQPDVPHEAALKALYRSMEEVLPVAEQQGVTVCVEPVFYHTLSSPELAKQLLGDMGSPRLKITFDPVNLFDVPDEKDQKSLWNRAFDAFGDDIRVVHMKGVRVVNGKLEKASFTDSVIDYPYLFGRLRKLNADLHVIREEVDPAHGAEDAAFLRALC